MSKKPSDFSESTLSSEIVYQGRLLKVREDRVLLHDGSEARREYVEHPGAVMIIALPDEATLLLERQYRYPLRRHFLELPAGKMEAGEDPLATAQRELVEECGYEAGSWRHIATMHPCIGYSDERLELYLARELSYVGNALDDGEFLEVVPTPIAEALNRVRSGEITDVKTVIGLLWLEKTARSGW